MSFQQVFGGNTIYPSDVSYLALALTANTTLEWSLSASTGNDIVARIIDVTPTGAYAITMPPADETGSGQVTTFFNAGPSTITIKNSAGSTLLSIAAGLTFTLYLTSNATAAGTWRSFQAGASTAQAQASALAGFGLVAVGSTLAQDAPVTTFSMDYTLGASDRAGAFVWTGGVGTLSLQAASTAGDGFFVAVRNGGTGALTIDPAGADTINGDSSLVLQPGDSAELITDGTSWWTVGFGQDAVFAFDYTSISLTGETSPYVLSGAELNRISYDFVGILTADMEVTVPGTIQQYWVANDTTGGSYTLSIGVSGQSPYLTVPRGARGIYYSDGSQIIKADTASIATPIAISDGGTGATTASDARINLGGTATGIGVFTAASQAAALAAIGGAADGVNNDITELTGLTTPLSVSQGGTAATSAGAARTSLAVPGLATDNDFTAKNTFTGSTADIGVKLLNALEKVTVSATAATGTITYDVTTQSVVYYTSSAIANWTLNLRGNGSTTLDTLMATGESVTVAFLVTQGATPYYNNVVQVDGTAVGVTTKWQGVAPTAGVASSVNAYLYTVIKTGAATFTVLASQVAYV